MDLTFLVPLDRHLIAPLGPSAQEHLLIARQLQAISVAVHIPLVCFGIAFPAIVLFTEGLWLRTDDPVKSSRNPFELIFGCCCSSLCG